MVRPDLVSAKLAELSGRLGRVRRHCPATAEALRADQDALDLVAFNLMLAVQLCSDVASHLISDEGWPAASGLADAFVRLAERGVISRETSSALGRAVGLRNVVAHGYGGIDAELAHSAATRGLADLDRFAQEVASWVSGRADA